MSEGSDPLRKTMAAGMVVLAGLTGLTACEKVETLTPSATFQSEVPLDASPNKDIAANRNQALEALDQFIHSKLTGPYGVYTNLLDTNQSEEAASGHEVLSESASLLMRAAVLSGDKERFAEEWMLAKRTFDIDSGFSYRYSPKLQKQYPVNAAVDDLRIIGSLYEAGIAFENEGYTEEADKFGQRFYNNNVKNGYLYDFYDKDYKITNKFITLCYINLGTLQKLSINSELRNILIKNMEQIIAAGYLSDEFPFYETRFNYEGGTYSSENINTVESLLSILALAEVDQHKSSSIEYIKQQVEAETLYGQYTREGKPLNDIRSTAIYAITAMIGSEIGDGALYRTSIERMNEFRITDVSSNLYGGFGDSHSGQAYSFDNLMALLAYMYPI